MVTGRTRRRVQPDGAKTRSGGPDATSCERPRQYRWAPSISQGVTFRRRTATRAEEHRRRCSPRRCRTLIPQMMLSRTTPSARCWPGSWRWRRTRRFGGSPCGSDPRGPAALRRPMTKGPIVDGSGLSDDNAVPPSSMRCSSPRSHAAQQQPRHYRDGLPVAGGPVAPSRFTGANSGRAGRPGEDRLDRHRLHPVGHHHRGRRHLLTFAFFALGTCLGHAKQAIDTLVTGAYRCGEQPLEPLT